MIPIPNLTFAVIAFIGGILLITWGADALLDGIADISNYFSLSPLILAFLVMGIDLEETIASIGGALRGLPELAIGNVIGNSIISISFCFALPALFFVISLEKIKNTYILILGSLAVVVLVAVIFPQILPWAGIFAIGIYIFFIIWNLRHIKMKENSEEVQSNTTTGEKTLVNDEDNEKKSPHLPKMFGMFLFAIVALLEGTDLLLSGTELMLTQLHLEEAFFGVVIIAAATNMEEYVLLFRSIQKHRPEIGLAALLGKIIWNLSMTFGVSALIIRPQTLFSPLMLYNALLLTCILVPSLILLGFYRKELNWKWGFFYLCIFLLYLIMNLLFSK
jgi:cation:H+ antiporter